MLLRANSVNVVSTTVIYATRTLFPKLGITTEMMGKINDGDVDGVAHGEVDLALRPVSELMNVPGVDFVGPLPDEIQFISVFTAAISTSSKHPYEARQLITFLSSENATTVMRKSGLEPAGR
jgi:molybdate transport system substrate-binding protein